MKKYLAFTAAVLCAATVFTSCAGGKKGTDMQAVQNNPGHEVTQAVTTTIEKSIEKTPVAVLNNVYDSGDIHVIMEMETEQGQNFSYEAWVASAQKDPRAAVKLDFMGIDGTLYLDTKSLVIESNKLLGAQAYGIGLENFSQNLENSILPGLMGVDADELLENMGEIVTLLENLGDYLEEQEQYQKELEANLGNIISSVPCTTSEQNFSVSDGAVQAVVLDCKITPEFVSELAKEYALSSFKNPAFAYVYGDDYDDLIDELVYEIDYEVEEMFDDIGTNEVPLTVVINKATGEFIYAELVNNRGEKLYLDLGKDPGSSEKWVLGVEEGSELHELVITKKFSGNNGEFSITADNEEIMAFVVSGGRFDLRADGMTVATGKCNYSKNSFEITIEDISSGAEMMKIAVDTKAAPKVPKYKELLTMTMAEFQQLAQRVQMNAMSAMSGMGMLGQ